MYKNKICLICKKEFTPNASVHKYCSDECFNKHRKEQVKEWLKKYYPNNREKFIRRVTKYRLSHKKKINQHLKERRKIDIIYKLQNCLRCSIRRATKNNYKSVRTEKLIGCSVEQLKQHLESKFVKGMSWSNHGSGWNGMGMKEWHIDHIKPCASFDLSKPSEQHKCFHYTNLQPLWATENLSKGVDYENL
jgi:YesN/AraC family two-component response regulator